MSNRRNPGSISAIQRGAWLLLFLVLVSQASDLDEFKIKREEIFEFVQKPVVSRQGDRVVISFETKGFCDVTIAIEDRQG
ncbi:MAG: hypothetical protein ACUVWX_01065 [Kiritimatiellia bacterium]